MRPRWREVSWSYQQTANYAAGIASILERYSVGYQERVIIIAPNSPYWVGSYFGILQKGAIVVPLNPQSTEDFIEKVIEETRAKVLLKPSFLWPEKSFEIPVIDIDLQEDLADTTSTFDVVDVKEEDLAEIVYTSGTTGDPKGVMLTHKNIVSNVRAISKIQKVSSSDRTVSILPLFHMYEQTCCMLMGLAHGAQAMFATSVSSGAIQKALQEQRATMLLVVPEILETILRKIESRAEEAGKAKLLDKIFSVSHYLPRFMRRLIFRKVHKTLGGKLKIIASGGAYLNPDTERKWNAMGFIILQGYGLTETSPVISTNTLKHRRVGSVGRVIFGTKVTLDKDNEIVVEGQNVFKGYYKNEEKTKEAFDKNGRFKTGDIGSFDKDGYLYITGRKKYVIVSGTGQNIYPEDIEKEFVSFPDIKDIAIVGFQANGREVVYAVFLTDLDRDAVGLIVEEVNSRLAPYQRIQDWDIWPEADFPRSAIRKVKKNDVIEWIQHKERADIVSKPEREATRLVKLLAAVSGKDASTIHDDTNLVSDLYFDSLMRIELVGRIEEIFDIAIDENAITSQTTLKDLEKMLEGKPAKKKVERKFKSWIISSGSNFFRGLIQKFILFPIGKFFFKIKVEGIENLKGINLPAIFMANHISYLDPYILVKAMPKKIRKKIAIAAAFDVLYKEYWYIAWFAEFVMNTYILPRREDVNIRPGLERTGRILDKGYSVLIFPEGRISLDGKFQPLKKGAGLLAAEMGVPIVPMSIKGTRELAPKDKLFPIKRGKVVVKFGKPITFAPNVSYEDATEVVHAAMKKIIGK